MADISGGISLPLAMAAAVLYTRAFHLRQAKMPPTIAATTVMMTAMTIATMAPVARPEDSCGTAGTDVAEGMVVAESDKENVVDVGEAVVVVKVVVVVVFVVVVVRLVVGLTDGEGRGLGYGRTRSAGRT
jgi:hypothetical protein